MAMFPNLMCKMELWRLNEFVLYTTAGTESVLNEDSFGRFLIVISLKLLYLVLCKYTIFISPSTPFPHPHHLAPPYSFKSYHSSKPSLNPSSLTKYFMTLLTIKFPFSKMICIFCYICTKWLNNDSLLLQKYIFKFCLP